MAPISRFLLLLAVANAHHVLGDREHKVHNIVLYPDKYSWCVTTPIQQIVASPGYKSVTIDNNVCVGACYSYSIPKTQPAEPGELIGPYCDSCQPAKIACYHVNLQPMDEKAAVLQKRVQIIEDCACTSCDKLRKDDCDINNENTLELPANFVYQTQQQNQTEEEEPELLKMQKKVSESWHHKHHYHHKHLVDRLEHGNASMFGYKRVQDLLQDDSDDVIDRIIPIPEDNEPAVVQEHKPHHLGDLEQVSGTLEELIIGPHGSKVLRPVEKLQIDSDALKTIDEGEVISYEDHQVKKDNSID